jgi:hypothetical protein
MAFNRHPLGGYSALTPCLDDKEAADDASDHNLLPDDTLATTDAHRTVTGSSRLWNLRYIFTHLIVLCCYSAAFAVVVVRQREHVSCQRDLVYCMFYLLSLSRPVLIVVIAPVKGGQWNRVTLNTPLDDVNPFKGRPRPELDDAWNKLLKGKSDGQLS